MIHKLIKSWIFDEANRSVTEIVTSDKARLNAEDPAYSRLQLKQVGVGASGRPIYSTDNDITVRSRLYTPNAIQKWTMFEPYYKTNETDYLEYSLELSNKVGNTFDFGDVMFPPKEGDRVYQGDYSTTIDSFLGGQVVLTDATNISNGRVYCLRSECEVNFRIYDSSNNKWYYNVGTSSWEAAGASDWNTEFQISNNISTLDIANIGKGIGYEINLKTNDERYTPLLSELKMLGEFEIEFAEDIIFDSVIHAIEDELVVTTQIDIQLGSATDTIDFANEYQLENIGYNFTDGMSVYNLTTDPDRLVNLFSSYTPGAARRGGGNDPGVLTLTGVQAQDSVLGIKMKYFPEIAVNTSLDFYEVARIPSIVFERVERVNTMVGENSNIGIHAIRNKLTLTGVKLEPPAVNDLIFEYAVFTGNQSDQHRMGEALQRLFNKLHYIYSWGLDEPYPVVVRDVFRASNNPNASNVNTHTGQFIVQNVMTSIKEPRDVYLVDYLQNSMSTN